MRIKIIEKIIIMLKKKGKKGKNRTIDANIVFIFTTENRTGSLAKVWNVLNYHLIGTQSIYKSI